MNSSAVYSTNYWPQLIAANLTILTIMLVLEKGWGFRYETSKQIVYEKIELIRPDRQAELQADLEKRTGLKIKRIVVGKVDFLRDIANIKVYYEDPTQGTWLHNPDPAPVILVKDETGEF
jgi:hypothetical protein